jgi:SAM-dependent methyltransferase
MSRRSNLGNRSRVRRYLRSAFDAANLLPLYFRLSEWRLAHSVPRPPRCDVDGVPIPSRLLVTQVVGEPDWRTFLQGGRDNVDSIAAFAREGGVELADATYILDFGCGCGRVIRHLPSHTKAALMGVDYNPRAIGWCARNLKGEFRTNRLHPPLDLPADRFDLVYLLSVFTHLHPDTQGSWLAELARVARPGGIVLTTFHDESHPALESFTGALRDLQRDGVYFYNDRLEGSNLFSTFQTRAAARALFENYFEVVRIVPPEQTGAINQALAILRKRSH